MIQELIDVVRSLANGRRFGPDLVPVKLLKITLSGTNTFQHRHRHLEEGEVPQKSKDATIEVLRKKNRT